MGIPGRLEENCGRVIARQGRNLVPGIPKFTAFILFIACSEIKREVIAGIKE